MKKLFDAVATVGKYKDGQGNEKKRYVTIGAVFQDDQGRMSMKLDATPCSPDWTGWVSFFEPQQGQGQAPKPAPQPKHGEDFDTEDDIPF